tara:strand:- start:406 stop:825 length:420 start_codon:yes stop_codon:yes gene_type:complete
MVKEDKKNIKLTDLNYLRSAPKLDKKQSKILFNEVIDIVSKADWITIGIMAPSIKKGINAMRDIEVKLQLNKMKCKTIPSSDGPIFLKANQKTGEIHARIEYGLGEGILISCQNNDNNITATTIGPFPLDFFNNKNFIK